MNAIKIERIRASESNHKAPARIRANSDPPGIPHRIRAVPNTTARIKSNISHKKNENGVWEESPGVFLKMVECEGDVFPWPCTQLSGYIKDHRTATHVSNYGRVFRLLTKEEETACNAAIRARMDVCFPNSPWQRGLIPRRAPWMEKERAKLLREEGCSHGE